MTLGADFKEVLEEVGVLATVIQAVPFTEYVKTKVNAQVTKPFVREFFLEADLASDTAIAAGDVLSFPDGRIFLVMNLTPKLFEGAAWKHTVVLYKCNVAGVLYRQQTVTLNYQPVVTWDIIKSPCNCLMTESYYGHEFKEDGDAGPVSEKAVDCYLPRAYGAVKGDRVAVSDTEYYQVESIMLRRYDQVDLIQLGEDVRGWGV